MELIDDRSGLAVIDRAECVELLRAQGWGRLGVATGDEAVILPVNYGMDGEDVVFRTAPGTKFHSAVHRSKLSLQIDAVDPVAHTGWSVLLVGQAEEVTAASELGRLEEEVRVQPWAEGDKPHWIRIRPRRITGRRIVHQAG